MDEFGKLVHTIIIRLPVTVSNRLNARQSKISTEFRLKTSIKPSIWCFFRNVKRSLKVFWFYIRRIYRTYVYRKRRKIREFKKLLRQRQGQRRLKNEFIFYLRISRYFQVIYFVSLCQNYLETGCGTQR